jgi:hypothetical protein
VFLHLVTVSHVVDFGASGAQNIDILFFILGWDPYGFDNKRAGARYTELVFWYPVGSACHVVHSVASGM